MRGGRSLGRLAAWTVAIPLAVVVVFFAIGNRALVTIDLWPFPATPEIPLFVVVMATFIVGFMVGAVLHWIVAGGLRLRARRAERRAEVAERELAALREAAEDSGNKDGNSPRRLSHAA